MSGKKRLILATLPQEVKEQIDIASLPPSYASAVSLKSNGIHIIPDLSSDNFEAYKELDSSIYVNPMALSALEQQNLDKLCKICPQMNISDDLGISESSVEEYLNGEKWINQVIQTLNPEWSNIEKVAFIDNAIGKKVSYSPDFKTEVFDQCDSRALWKIINSGYGVCDGIAQVEHYMLNKIGIESEMVSGRHHAFLKLSNMEFPTPTGGTVNGNTILDPTWNLAAHRLGARPNNFCLSYEEIRKHDIKIDGEDSKAHKNDEKLSDATFNIPDSTLRQIYTSVGVADKDGRFPIKSLIEKSKYIDNLHLSNDENINSQLKLLEAYCPEFATCINSTYVALKDILLVNPNLCYNKCVVDRVYDKKDDDRNPVLYVYLNLLQDGNRFYFADKEAGQFISLSQKEFEEKFECYENDLDLTNGVRPWEDHNNKQVVEDLTKSSGNIDTVQEEER